MSLKWLVTVGAVCVALLADAGIAHAQKLIKAELYTKTGDDNKDKDTGVYVTVTTNDGNTLLAEIKNADSSGDDKTEYNDNSDHTIELVIKSSGSTKTDCQKFKFRVGSQAKGNDKWKITKATLTLTFDDNTTLSHEVGAFELNSRGSKLVESEWFEKK